MVKRCVGTCPLLHLARFVSQPVVEMTDDHEECVGPIVRGAAGKEKIEYEKLGVKFGGKL